MDNFAGTKTKKLNEKKIYWKHVQLHAAEINQKNSKSTKM